MPILQNAKKALRVSERRATINQRVKARTKTMLDKMKKQPSLENLSTAFSAIDKATKQHIFHRNKASRLKAQLSKLLAVK